MTADNQWVLQRNYVNEVTMRDMSTDTKDLEEMIKKEEQEERRRILKRANSDDHSGYIDSGLSAPRTLLPENERSNRAQMQ